MKPERTQLLAKDCLQFGFCLASMTHAAGGISNREAALYYHSQKYIFVGQSEYKNALIGYEKWKLDNWI